MTELVTRRLRAGEADLFLSMSEPATVGVALLGRDFRALFDAGQYRPQWTFVALRDGVVIGRAAWWGGPDDAEPLTLDWFDPGDDPEVGAALLRAAPFHVEYHLMVPPDWRDRPEARKAVQLRVAAHELVGRELVLERLGYAWTPADGLPERPSRLSYRPVPDDATLEQVLRRILVGSLDFHHRRAGIDEAVRGEMEFFAWMPSPRGWLRLAYDEAGDVVGLVVPGRNQASAIIGFVGVVPEQRGRGYAYDLLVEGTYLLVEAGADQITADTDVGNTPMAETFAKARYPVTRRRLILI